jgi:hypothetical protein
VYYTHCIIPEKWSEFVSTFKLQLNSTYTAFSTGTASTPTPGGDTTSYRLMFTVKLSGISKDAFTNTLQQRFKSSIAVKVNVSAEKVALLIADSARRRLLAGAGVSVNVTITFNERAKSITARGFLTKAVFQEIVASTSGLANITVSDVTTPIEVISDLTKSIAAKHSSPRTSALGLLLVALAVMWVAHVPAGQAS